MTLSHRFLGVLCIVALLSGTFVVPAAAQGPANGQFVVELDASGDADVVFTDEYDLTDSRERAIFESARENEDVRRQAGVQFRNGMQSISDEANAAVDRELRIGEVTVGTRVDGDTGTVAYRFRWENLAAIDGDRIVLSEPFSTYDSLDRELIVLAPEGNELTSVSPQPQRQGEDVATWPGLTRFGEGFEVVSTGAESSEERAVTPEPPIDPADAHGSGPIALAVSALLVAVLLIGRQR